MTTALPAFGASAIPRPWLTLTVYAWAATLLCLHAVVSLVAMPLTLVVDPDRRFAAHVGSWMTRTALLAAPQWRSAVRGLSMVGAGRGGRPAVIVMNHRSIADIAIAVAVPGGPKIVSKPWAGRVPLIGLAMRLCGHLVVEPGSAQSVRQLMMRAEGLLARGNSVLFFPEGTRRTSSGVGAFHEGAFRLAVKMHVDVLPVVLHATGELVPRGSLVLRDAAVDVVALPRVPSGCDRHALARRVRAAMAAELAGRA